MPSAQAIDAGRAVLRVAALDVGVRSTLNEIEDALEQTVARVRNVGLAIAAAGVAGLGSFTVAINEAARAEEIASKFAQVFGQSEAAAASFFRSLADEVGRSETDLREFGASFQDLLQPIGFDPSEAREYSQALTELAVDLGSFNNRNDADVIRDLQAALTGSSETLKRYGVIANESAVAQQLLNDNIDPGEATEVEKVFARLAIIFRQTSAAQGDAARTAGSFANQTKALAAAVRDAAGAVGQALLPVVTPVVSLIREIAVAIRNIAEEFPILSAFAATAAAALTVAGGAIAAVSVGVGLLLSPITLLSIALAFAGQSLTNLAFQAARATASVLTLSGATRAAAFAIGLLTGAARAFIATPLGFALAAASVLLPILAAGLAGAASEARAASAAFDQAAAALNGVTDAVAAAQSLRELANAGELNEDQQRRANELLNQISTRYRTFGIAVDSTTGRIVAQEGAFRSLFELLGRNQRESLEAAATQAAKNVAELEVALASAERAAQRGGQGRQARARRFQEVRQQLAEARGEAERLRAELAALPNSPSASGIDDGPTEEELRQRAQLNERFARQERDAEIAAIEDTRERRIDATEEAARRDLEQAERVGADKAAIERRLATQKATINREADAQIEQERQRAEDARQRQVDTAEGRARDAEISNLADPRERELVALEEYRRRELELAQDNARQREAIEREVVARKQAINRRFNEEQADQGRRADEQRRNRALQLARANQIAGSLATRVAAQQFSRGVSDEIPRQQLVESRRQTDLLQRIERRRNGLRAI